MRQLFFKNRNLVIISILFLVFFLLLTPFDLFNKEIPPNLHTGFFSIITLDIPADDGGHYAYLRSLFFDHDIDFVNEPFNPAMRANKITGYIDNPWPIGTSFFWLPFFLFGHLTTIILNAFGCNLNIDGYSFPYISMIAVGSIFYGFLGVLFLNKSLCNFFKPEIALLVTISTFFSSTLPYYVYIRPYMDISLDFFNLSLFTYLLTTFVKNTPNTKLFYLFFGITCGVMSITRFNGILHTTSFFFFLSLKYIIFKAKNETPMTFGHKGGRNFPFRGHSEKSEESSRFLPSVEMAITGKRKLGRPLEFNHLCLIATGFFITILPQLIVNFILNGSLIDTGPALTMNILPIKWDGYICNLGKIFIGSTGIIYQCPIIIVGFLGYIIYFLKNWKKEETIILFYVSILLGFLLEVLLTARLPPALGCEYGIKYMVAPLIFISFGVATFLDYIWRKGIPFFIFGVIIFVVWQYIQLIQYRVTGLWNEFSMFEVPLTFFYIIDNAPSLLLRSSNLITLIFHGYFRINTIVDFYFLIFIPLFLAILILTVLVWKSLLFNLIKNRIIIIAILLLFVSLSFLLIRQPKKSREEINRRYLLYSTLDNVICRFDGKVYDSASLRTVFLNIENKLQNYNLGIKAKDSYYFYLINLKN